VLDIGADGLDSLAARWQHGSHRRVGRSVGGAVGVSGVGHGFMVLARSDSRWWIATASARQVFVEGTLTGHSRSCLSRGGELLGR